MVPFGTVFKVMCVLALIGLAVGLLIGAAIIVVPVIAVGGIGVYVYRRQASRVRSGY